MIAVLLICLQFVLTFERRRNVSGEDYIGHCHDKVEFGITDKKQRISV